MNILHVASITGKGGVGRFIDELIRGINDPQITQDVLSVCRPVYYESPCHRFGPLVQGRGFRASLVGAVRLESFLREHSYDAVHIHTNNSAGFAYAEAAKRAGVKHRIVHSHNTSLGSGSSRAKYALDGAIKKILTNAPTARLACSKDAGEFLFCRTGYTVVPNGIDTARFAFSCDARASVRARYGLDGCLVLGVCSNLSPEKNVQKSLHVLNALLRIEPKARMLIVGEGDEERQLRQEAESLSLSASIVWAGMVPDPQNYYSAMDCLLMPSIYEGLPLSLVEAQANGLPALVSDRITQEAVLTERVRMISNDASDCEWADAANTLVAEYAGTAKRVSMAHRVAEAGYDKESTLKAIEQLYDQLT